MSDIVERLEQIIPYWPTHEQDVRDAIAEIKLARAALKTCLRYFEGDWDGEPEEAERIATQKVRAALEGK